ncbi:hypothetical protein GW17_00039121 [Ensete ventricosum]|nr:hypothetical protein GW17_00039121 [Ensete ventricosum]
MVLFATVNSISYTFPAFPFTHLQQISDFDLFTLDDIDTAFQNVTRLTYSQNCHLSGCHLNGTVLESFVRPAVLITDAYNALNNQLYKRQRDQEFIGISLINAT